VSRFNHIHTASLALACALSGCTSNPDFAQSTSAVQVSERNIQAVPVYVVPHCQTLAGEQHCQWIVPRGYQNNSPASGEPVHGIAI
jgi:hypothetical protein